MALLHLIYLYCEEIGAARGSFGDGGGRDGAWGGGGSDDGVVLLRTTLRRLNHHCHLSLVQLRPVNASKTS